MQCATTDPVLSPRPWQLGFILVLTALMNNGNHYVHLNAKDTGMHPLVNYSLTGPSMKSRTSSCGVRHGPACAMCGSKPRGCVVRTMNKSRLEATGFSRSAQYSSVLAEAVRTNWQPSWSQAGS